MQERLLYIHKNSICLMQILVYMNTICYTFAKNERLFRNLANAASAAAPSPIDPAYVIAGLYASNPLPVPP